MIYEEQNTRFIRESKKEIAGGRRLRSGKSRYTILCKEIFARVGDEQIGCRHGSVGRYGYGEVHVKVSLLL
jgi:hypothetical protein